MTRRDALRGPRAWLLRCPRLRGTELPRLAMAVLMMLDKWSAERAVDKPWTSAASDRMDRILARKDRER